MVQAESIGTILPDKLVEATSAGGDLLSAQSNLVRPAKVLAHQRADGVHRHGAFVEEHFQHAEIGEAQAEGADVPLGVLAQAVIRFPEDQPEVDGGILHFSKAISFQLPAFSFPGGRRGAGGGMLDPRNFFSIIGYY